MDSEELRNRTKVFASRIIRLFRALPQTGDAQVIGKQILRSATSIGANYRAACRARSRSEFIAKLGIVVEEADETVYWLELLADNSILPPQQLQHLLTEANQLTAIFATARHTSRQQITNRKSKITNG